MNIEDQFGLEHLLFEQRKCKICGEMKELINDFYKTRKDRGNVPSAYAYECKRCSIKRVSQRRKKKDIKEDLILCMNLGSFYVTENMMFNVTKI